MAEELSSPRTYCSAARPGSVVWTGYDRLSSAGLKLDFPGHVLSKGVVYALLPHQTS